MALVSAKITDYERLQHRLVFSVTVADVHNAHTFALRSAKFS